MAVRMKQKAIVIALAMGIVVMVGGTAAATWLPMGGRAAHRAARPAAESVASRAAVAMAARALQRQTVAGPSTPPPTTAPVAPAPAPAPVPAAAGPRLSISYTVQPGDTLSVIAQWFKENGYEALYQQNMAIIGSNPNLIYPGETLTITNGALSMTP